MSDTVCSDLSKGIPSSGILSRQEADDTAMAISMMYSLNFLIIFFCLIGLE